jgi:hypothetical protein
MCPLCIASVALVVAGTVSTGGLTSLLAFKLSKTPSSTEDSVKKIGSGRHD